MALNSYNSPTTRPIYRATQVIWYLCALLEVVLAFRFFLHLAGANPGAGFTDFIYAISLPFVQPFLTVFRVTAVDGRVFEWTTLLAMFVYLLIAWGITSLLVMGRTVSTAQAAERLEEDDTTTKTVIVEDDDDVEF